MSRIGKQPIKLASGVTASLDGRILKIKGPKGELSLKLSNELSVKITDESIEVNQVKKDKDASAISSKIGRASCRERV